MKAQTKAQSKTRVDIWNEVARFSQNAGMTVAALIGVWAVLCLASGLVGHGFIGLLKGFITAVTGG